MIMYIDLLRKAIPFESMFQGTLLSLDPGETTGYSVFDVAGYDVKMTKYGQIVSHPLEKGMDEITALISFHQPNFLVYEDYRVYAWKANSHSWAALHTPQLLGCIRMRCKDYGVKCDTQMAQHAKQFMTDDKLERWGFQCKGKHAKDSIRHGLFWILFTSQSKGTPVLLP